MSTSKICRDCGAEELEDSTWSCHHCGGVLQPPLRESGILASARELIELCKADPKYGVPFLLLLIVTIAIVLGFAYVYFGFYEYEGMAGPVLAVLSVVLSLSLFLAWVYYQHRKKQKGG